VQQFEGFDFQRKFSFKKEKEVKNYFKIFLQKKKEV
jgi:hypothetical protein